MSKINAYAVNLLYQGDYVNNVLSMVDELINTYGEDGQE